MEMKKEVIENQFLGGCAKLSDSGTAARRKKSNCALRHALNLDISKIRNYYDHNNFIGVL